MPIKEFFTAVMVSFAVLPLQADPVLENAPEKRIIFLAGKPSHPSGAHEFRAGCMLLAEALNEQSGLALGAQVISEWPENDAILEGADTIVIYCDSDSIHREHYPRLMEISESGTGLFFMHYGVHPKKIENGQQYYLPLIGGFMESGHSVNPHWAADLTANPEHPIYRGCETSASVFDEFYYALRFADDPTYEHKCDCGTVHSLVTGIPTKANMVEGSNLWNKNATDAYGKPVRLMWGFEKENGTRSGGFTGGHYHRNWAHDGFRKLVLNAIVWTAGIDVPKNGVQSAPITEEQINANLDKKKEMTKITLPLKTAMEYRQVELDRRAAKKR